jgi:hypothetical protein
MILARVGSTVVCLSHYPKVKGLIAVAVENERENGKELK